MLGIKVDCGPLVGRVKRGGNWDGDIGSRSTTFKVRCASTDPWRLCATHLYVAWSNESTFLMNRQSSRCSSRGHTSDFIVSVVVCISAPSLYHTR